jgi:hypothetical protein
MRGKLAKAIRRKIREVRPDLSPEIVKKSARILKKNYKQWRQNGMERSV